MAPLTIPQRPQGGLRAPFLIYPPECEGAFESAGGAIYNIKFYCGARRCAVARFRRELVLRVGSSGENGKEFLVFELGALLAFILRQQVASLARCSGELGGGSSFWERTFVCN